MTDLPVRTASRVGHLYYTPHEPDSSNLPPYNGADSYRQRAGRPHRVTVYPVQTLHIPEFEERAASQRCHQTGKVAGNRDTALRFLRSVIVPNSSAPKIDLTSSGSETRSRANTVDSPSTVPAPEMPTVDSLRSTQARNNSVPINAHLRRPSLQEDSRQSSTSSAASVRTQRAGSLTKPEDKPLAAGNGVSINVNLAEPYLFLQGHDENDRHTSSTAMLRGSLHLKVVKNVKLKTVALTFRGVATTKWPEGIPPKKVEFEEHNTLMTHTWPFFNAQFPNAEEGSGADQVRLASNSAVKNGSPYMTSSPVNSNVNLSGRDQKRLSLQVNQTRSFEKGENGKHGSSVAQRGYRTFYPGDYIYNFELPLDSRLPESIDVDLGSVKYELEATVERAGAFKTNLLGHKEVVLIRAPSEGSLEQVEPIAISRNWEDQLHYDIVISGKSFPLGSKVPIAFKLTPLAKVQCHRIKVFVTENTEYFCSHKRVHRMEPVRKILLFEKRADSPSSSTFPGSDMRITAGGGVPFDQRAAAASGEEVAVQDPGNLLGRLDADSSVGPTEMEFNVQLPGCRQSNEKEKASRLHFDTTYQNVQVHHWIKIVMRLSRPDTNDPSKRRHFEISIDSPFHILSCRATQANTALPAYSSPDTAAEDQNLAECGCPGAPQRRISPSHLPTLNTLNDARQNAANAASESNTPVSASTESSALPLRLSSLPRPPPAHLDNSHVLQRPMHMLRAPSFNPPSFEEEEPPPPLVTPPPNYADIASPSHGMEDYFSRLHTAYDDESDEDPGNDGASRSSARGRVNVPLTPGRRANRSMDAPRSPYLS